MISKHALMQGTLLVCGGTSMFLLSEPKLLEYGFWLILVSQVFWFIETTRTKQWGIFALGVIYAVSALNGLRNVYGLF